jgi:serine phosphatase RsbU (regulator of sigma subunit)
MPNSAGEHFGKSRLRTAIQTAASRSAAEIVEAIVTRLTEFRGDCRQSDDVTFVVIKTLQIDAAPTI